jgi:bifunctional enzyme CysN/CysC
MSVIVRLSDDLDVSQGDMICRPHNTPKAVQDIEAMVCWISETPLHSGQKLALKHTTRTVRALVKELQYRLDVNTLLREPDIASLRLNDIGRLRLRTTVPLLGDDYRRNRTTGSFVLINEATNRTVGAGMISELPPVVHRPGQCSRSHDRAATPFRRRRRHGSSSPRSSHR